MPATWLRWGALATFFLAWEVGARLAASIYLPPPSEVGVTLLELATSGELFTHLGATLARVLASFVLAMAIGTALGIWMGRVPLADRVLDGLLILGLNVPALVTIILCYIWFGLTEAAAVTAVAVNKIPTVVVTLREGARALDPRLQEVAHVYGVSPSRTLTRIVLPQLYPYLMAAARSGLSLIWKIVLVVELLGRSNGVGFELAALFQLFDIRGILAWTLAFAAVVLTIEALVLRPLETRINRWRT